MLTSCLINSVHSFHFQVKLLRIGEIKHQVHKQHERKDNFYLVTSDELESVERMLRLVIQY